MQQVIGISVALDIVMALVALGVVWGVMRAMDWAVFTAEKELPDSVTGRWAEAVDRIDRNAIASAVYRSARWIGACLLIGMLLGCSAPASAAAFPGRYDNAIQDAAERFMPAVDWRLYKAQLYQESQLDPAAESPVGAQGLAQFMPGTWQDVASELGYGDVSPHMVEPAIIAGAYYTSSLRQEWSAPRPPADRHSLALASYNAGLGNLLAAQRRCGSVNLYAEIVRCLPSVTGEHANETITYVSRTWRWWQQMLLG